MRNRPGATFCGRRPGANKKLGHEPTPRQKLNAFEDGGYLGSGDLPSWWSWYGWPSWWNYFNGTGRITWKLTLEPKQIVELNYDWHYFWR